MSDLDRRQFVSAAALSLGALRVRIAGERERPEAARWLDDVKQIDAGLLNVGYADVGPANGPVVLLLHGWPYDIQSYAQVAPLLTAKGYRVVVLYLRGYGTTRFRSADARRNGQQAALASDVIDLMDALKIRQATVGGFAWGSRPGGAP